jgi:hypothetical protein
MKAAVIPPISMRSSRRVLSPAVLSLCIDPSVDASPSNRRRDALKYESKTAGSSQARVISLTASFVSDLMDVSTVMLLVEADNKRVAFVELIAAEQPRCGSSQVLAATLLQRRYHL